MLKYSVFSIVIFLFLELSTALQIVHKVEYVNDFVTNVYGYKEGSDEVMCALQHNATYKTIGWDTMEVQTNPDGFTDEEQAYCAGQLEGWVSSDAIWYHYHNTLKGLCKGQQEMCKNLTTFLNTHLDWVEEYIALYSEADSDWHHVSVFLNQVKGLQKGYTLGQTDTKKALSLTDFFLLNIAGDVDEITQALGGDVSSKVRGDSHCSAIIKLLPNNKDILIAHNTWNEYTAMWRMLKRYTIPLRVDGQSEETVPGVSITFSGYPGVINSVDDFYVTSSGLVAMETTIGNANPDLWQYVKPTGQILESVRSLTAMRMADSGSTWCRTFSKYNSGTYNNQWMIIDLNKFQAGSVPGKGTLYVLEQIPSYIRWADQTELLVSQTYWPSYNEPFYQDVFNKSGNQELVEEYGDWFSYNKTARAEIFRRDHSSVKDLDSLMKLMRYNDYTNDPYSVCNCTPPYSAENAIAARSDLNPKNGKYPFEALGHRPHGAVDAKVTSTALAKDMMFTAVCGPTTGNNLPKFNWKKSDYKHLPHLGQPNVFNFKPTTPQWQGPFF